MVVCETKMERSSVKKTFLNLGAKKESCRTSNRELASGLPCQWLGEKVGVKCCGRKNIVRKIATFQMVFFKRSNLLKKNVKHRLATVVQGGKGGGRR